MSIGAIVVLALLSAGSFYLAGRSGERDSSKVLWWLGVFLAICAVVLVVLGLLDAGNANEVNR